MRASSGQAADLFVPVQRVLETTWSQWARKLRLTRYDSSGVYNHSPTHNAHYPKNYTDHTIDIIATHDINPGEEITVDYTTRGSNTLWFTPHP
jgi:hypothetical protein